MSHNHEHKHTEDCCHGHHHDHGSSCSCSHDHHDCCSHIQKGKLSELSDAEQHFLEHLALYKCLPVAQFVLKSSKEGSFESVALSPVFITETTDTMEQVKNFGEKLKNLEAKGFITLDYDIPIKDYSYSEYYESELFAYFKTTVEEGKNKTSFLGDVATIETGSMVIAE